MDSPSTVKRLLADTSFLVALTNPREEHHVACVQIAQTVSGQISVPVTVLSEATYLLHSHIGHAVMRVFLQEISRPSWEILGLETDDLMRSHAVLTQYADSELDFVDATLVALAERLSITTILTLDRRHFHVVRPRHRTHFELLP